jgi:hypothetical protein
MIYQGIRMTLKYGWDENIWKWDYQYEEKSGNDKKSQRKNVKNG